MKMHEEYCFDVALWRRWPDLFPLATAQVYASLPSIAVEALMHERHFPFVAYAVAQTGDRSITYRAHRVQVKLSEISPLATITDYNWLGHRREQPQQTVTTGAS